MKKYIISGGGTGGHIFPAIAIADEIKRRQPEAEILFVGAEGKMEMDRVPKAGYKIVGLPVVGFQRKLTLKNLVFPFKLLNSLWKARSIVKNFKPDVAIGVGGYASGPVLRMAGNSGVKTVLQEQNSFAGVTNRILAKKASVICTAYENVKRFFPEDKCVLTGNPVRADIVKAALVADKVGFKKEALAFYGLSESKKTILVIGGSLGARTLNESMINKLDLLKRDDVQVLWQCGKLYEETCTPHTTENIKVMTFVERMDYAYSAADVVISRAGALSVSELCLMGKATIFVPSPNVSEDHQTANAKALTDKNAALMVTDVEAKEKLVSTALELLFDGEKRVVLEKEISKLGIADSSERIVNQIFNLIK